MSDQPLLTGERDEILRVIRHVRNRWRLRVGLRSVAVLTAATLDHESKDTQKKSGLFWHEHFSAQKIRDGSMPGKTTPIADQPRLD